jgi:hypothetical protein
MPPNQDLTLSLLLQVATIAAYMSFQIYYVGMSGKSVSHELRLFFVELLLLFIGSCHYSSWDATTTLRGIIPVLHKKIALLFVGPTARNRPQT